MKILFLTSCLSRSLKVIGTDTDRSATYDFLLTFHSNYGPVSYRYRDKRRFQSKIANFPHPRVFCALAEVVALGIGYRRSGSKKLELEVCALCGDADPRRVCRELHFV